jgi:Sec-independent protein secretion pathway component TatC
MLSFFQIGVLEVVSLVVVTLVLGAIGIFKPAAWRWLAAIAAILIVATICTPADPISTWLVAIPACAVFAAGVILSPYLLAAGRSSSRR